MDLKITKEKVLEAAQKCSTAKDVLFTLFPEAFEEENKFIAGKGSNNGSVLAIDKGGRWIIAFPEGKLYGNEFELSTAYEWSLKPNTLPYLGMILKAKKK